MRSLTAVCALAMVVAVSALSHAEAQTATARISCPASAPRTGDTFSSDITIDVGAVPLGAFTIAVTYNTTVVTIASIAAGSAAEFASSLTTDPSDFPTGRTLLSAFQTASLTAPTGIVNVAHITFNAVGASGTQSPLGLDVITVGDTSGARISTTANGCVVTLPTAVPTLTATSIPSITPTATPTGTATGTATNTPPTTPTPTTSPTLTTTRTPTTTPTAASTATHTPSPTAKSSATPTATPTHTATVKPRCIGDCDLRGSVTVDEILTMVNIALESAGATLDKCPAGNSNNDNKITVDEILTAVNNALTRCP